MSITLSMWPKRRRPNTTGSRTAPKPSVSDSQWNLIKDLFEEPDPSLAGVGPPIPARERLEEILCVLKNGARWQDLPERYLSPATFWRRHRGWTGAGLLVKAWERLIRILDRRKLLNRKQAMGDGTFSPAKKAGLEVCKAKKGKGIKLMLMKEAQGISISAFTTSAAGGLATQQTESMEPMQLIDLTCF